MDPTLILSSFKVSLMKISVLIVVALYKYFSVIQGCDSAIHLFIVIIENPLNVKKREVKYVLCIPLLTLHT